MAPVIPPRPVPARVDRARVLRALEAATAPAASLCRCRAGISHNWSRRTGVARRADPVTGGLVGGSGGLTAGTGAGATGAAGACAGVAGLGAAVVSWPTPLVV